MKLNLISEILVWYLYHWLVKKTFSHYFFHHHHFFFLSYLWVVYFVSLHCKGLITYSRTAWPAWLHESISVVVHDHALTFPASTRIPVVGASHRCCMRIKFRVKKLHAKLPFWMCPMNWVSYLWIQNCQFGFDRKSL